MRSYASVAEPLKKIPTHSSILEGMASELQNSIRIGREHLAKTFLSSPGELACVVKAPEKILGFRKGSLKMGKPCT